MRSLRARSPRARQIRIIGGKTIHGARNSIMNQLDERIAQFRKMAHDDPDNELGHFRLGQLLMEAGQFAEASASFRRTLELSPQFSKVYQLLGTCLQKQNQRDDAVKVWREGFAVAD